jgi:hypothetical protein
MSSIKPAVGQFILPQTQIMAKLVQKSYPHLLPENVRITLGKIPEILQEQNDLRWNWNISIVRKFRPGEQAKGVRLDSLRLQAGVRETLQCHRQLFRAFAQRLGQRGVYGFHLRQRQPPQPVPVRAHNSCNLRRPCPGATPKKVSRKGSHHLSTGFPDAEINF